MAHALVVDDEHDVRFLLGLLLESAGMTVEVADNGEVALACLAQGTFDVVVLDLMMPVVDGWGVLEALHGRPDAPPVVVLTAHASPAERRRALDLGAATFVHKPFDPDRLAEQVLELAQASPDEVAECRRREMEQLQP